MNQKGIVIGVILLFIGSSVIPITANNIEKNLSSTSRGNWLYVGGNGPGNYSRIQDAIDNASDGDTIFVYSGTYPTSNIYIEKAIQLLGENKNTTIVESSSNVEINIKPHSHNVAISNFTFQNFIVFTHQNNNISLSNNIFLTTVYYGNPSVIDSSGSYNTFDGNTIILRRTTEVESGPQECMGLNEYHSTIINNTLVGATYDGLSLGGKPTENEQYGQNTVSGNSFLNNNIGLFLITLVTTIGSNHITQNNFINNSVQAGFTISVGHPFDLINVILSQQRIPYSQWDGNYWDDYAGHLGRKIPGKIQFFSTRFEIPVRSVDRHPASGPLYLNKELGSTISDIVSNIMNKYSYHTLSWMDRWPDWPGRYESFFKVKDIMALGQTAWGLTTADFNHDGLLDFAVSWEKYYSTISIFYNNGNGNFTKTDVYTHFPNYIIDLNAGDYDNDGDVDLMFTYDEVAMVHGWPVNLNGTVNILFNDGANNFGNETMVAWLGPGDPGSLYNRINPTVSSADFDNDGDIDFLVGDNSGQVEFYRNDGSGIFTSAGIYDFGGKYSWGVSSGDFDNDGDIDFIVTQQKQIDPHHDGCVLLVPNDGTEECFNQSDYVQIAVLPPRPSFYTDPILGYGCLCATDYNNDERMDFLYSGGDSLILYVQNVTGFFNNFTVCRLPGVNTGNNSTFYLEDVREGAIATGDFNGDGLDDLVVGGVQGVVRLFTNQRMLVDIIFPDREGIIIQNEYKLMLLPFYFAFKYGTSFAFGRITVVVKELEPLQKVEFYLGNRLIYTDDAAPYEWNWTSLSFGRHKIKAVPYDLNGKQAGSDDAIVWKFF